MDPGVFADSPDLATWTDRGKAVGDQGGEGPKVFRWKDAYWMITDVWDGCAVYRSDDTLNWPRRRVCDRRSWADLEVNGTCCLAPDCCFQ